MPKVPIDFSDVQDFEPLAKGDYEALIEEVTYVAPQVEDKYPYLNLKLRVTEDGYENRVLWVIWSLSPKALFRMKGDLENLGYDSDEIEIEYDEDSMIVTEPELAGMPVVASVTQRTWEGRLQNNVDALTATDSPKSGQKKAGTKAKSSGRKLR